MNDAVVLPNELKKECSSPVLLPDRALNDQEIEKLWGRDRYALVDCKNKHRRVVELY